MPSEWELAEQMLKAWLEARVGATGTRKQREIRRMVVVLRLVKEQMAIDRDRAENGPG